MNPYCPLSEELDTIQNVKSTQRPNYPHRNVNKEVFFQIIHFLFWTCNWRLDFLIFRKGECSLLKQPFLCFSHEWTQLGEDKKTKCLIHNVFKRLIRMDLLIRNPNSFPLWIVHSYIQNLKLYTPTHNMHVRYICFWFIP